MNTIILRNSARDSSAGKSWTIEVLGDGAAKDALQEAIRVLEHHPAKAARRSIIDMLALIQQGNWQIRHVEHNEPEDGMETWLFVLQG
jgi:hypothetical protein